MNFLVGVSISLLGLLLLRQPLAPGSLRRDEWAILLVSGLFLVLLAGVAGLCRLAFGLVGRFVPAARRSGGLLTVLLAIFPWFPLLLLYVRRM